MDVVSVCPLRVGTLIWQPRPSAWVLTVVCKATYLLRPGECVLAPEQDPPLDADSHWNDDPNRSVRAPDELVPVKPRADVLLVGQAFAPGNTPVRSLIARLVVGELDKGIEVFTDRVVSPSGGLQEGGPFIRQPLTYERAAGGPGTWNPVGIRAESRDAYGRRPLPNLVPVGTKASDMSTPVEPIGFGPIAPSWPQRRDKLGVHAGRFPPGAYRERPLPEFDLGYFNQAPRDQQLAELRDNERIVLENLHPEHARLVTSLPGIKPAVFTTRARAGSAQRLAMRADTLSIDTDRRIATLVFRGQMPIENRDERVRIAVLLETPGQEAKVADADRVLASRGSSTGIRAVPGASPPPAITPPLSADEEDVVGTTTLVPIPGQTPTAAPLPFAGNPAPAPPRKELPVQPPSGVLPFQSPPLGPSGASWSAAQAPPPRPPMGSSPDTAPVAPPPPRRPFESSSWPAGSPADVAAPPPVRPALPVVPPPVAATSREGAESPWAAGNNAGGSPTPETIGMAAAAAALATPPSPASPSPAPIPAPRPSARARLEPRELLKLLWFDPESVPRIRRKKPFREVLAELEGKALDPDLDDPALAEDPAAMEDRREVFEILARAPISEAERIQEALADAVREDGKFVPPLLLLAGDLAFPFDELETLKATLTTVTPLVTPGDDVLRANIELARDFLKTPGLLSGPLVAEGLTSRLKDAFAQGKRMVPSGYLEQQTERALLENRHYQKRKLFGGVHLRALLHVSGSSQVVPTYLPADLAESLPLYQRFRARVIVEVHLQEDQSETHSAALRVMAIARGSALPRR